MGERLARLRERVSDRWMAQTPAARTQGVVLLLIAALYGAHSLVYMWPQPFYIEDSAISFAYARNFVDGEGLVAYPGGERVEGYSNPLWTFLLAGFYAGGMTPWWSAKVLGALFGVITLLFVSGIARRARPEDSGLAAIVAPLLLACSTQFVLWNNSGLENSLFNVLLAAGIWSLTREIQDDRTTPWSALAFCGLTMTRPDGMMYAALGLFARLLGTFARGQWLAAGAWIVAFAVPFSAYNAWRYEYFAWPFPNTYYAKEKDFRPMLWTGGAWKQVRDYMTQYGIVYAAPIFVAAVAGLSTWRRWIGAVLLAFFAVFLLWDGRAGIPTSMAGDWSRTLARHWNDARVYYLLGAAVTLGALTFGRKGWEARGLLWGAMCGGIFFVVATGADWMKGFRWFSLTSVPVFTLLGVGIAAVAEHLPLAAKRIAGWLPGRAIWATPMVVALAFPNVNGSWTFANNPETAPRDIHKRVNYMTWVQNRLGLDQVTLLDVDMGAHMWWSGWDIVDIAGLVDVPMARHKKFNRAFITDYIFDERKPDFAHVHGSWAKTSKIHLNERWEDEYIEIPGYPSGRRALHVGNHVRKEHLAGKAYAGPPDRKVEFDGGVTLEGWDVPSPTVAPGGKLYVATTWQALPRTAGFRVLAFLADAEGHLHSAEVVPGYDWYRPERWDIGEHVYGNWNIELPESLPKGTYDIGFVVLDERTGAVLPMTQAAPGSADADGAGNTPGDAAPAVATPAVTTPADATPADAALVRFMKGEWRADAVVTVVSFEDAVAAADRDYTEALAQAGSGACAAAGETFRNARRHIARNDKWYLAHVDAVEASQVDCWVAAASGEPDPFEQARLLALGRALDHRHPGLVAAAQPLALHLVALGDTARADEDWTNAYRAYAAALSVDATLSWVRRSAEEVRDLRLGIDPEKADPPKPAKKKTPTKGGTNKGAANKGAANKGAANKGARKPHPPAGSPAAAVERANARFGPKAALGRAPDEDDAEAGGDEGREGDAPGDDPPDDDAPGDDAPDDDGPDGEPSAGAED